MKTVGRPVRVQGMRYAGHGWDPKGPASIHRARAALDKDGAVVGYVLESKGFSRVDIDTNQSDPVYSLAGQLMGLPLKSLQGLGAPSESYGFANKRLAWETIAPLLDRAPPLRTAHLRDPVGHRSLRAQRSNLDRDCCVAFGSSQLAFRLRYLTAPRDIAVVKAAAERANWEPRSSPNPDRNGDTLAGRGIAYAQRPGAVVAIVAEVEIDRRTGKVWARKFTVAHDCGLIINPDGLRRCIEGNVVQGTSERSPRSPPSTAPGLPAPTGSPTRSSTSPRRPRRSRRADQPARGCRRELDPPGCRGHRQRRLRCDRRALAPRFADPGAAQAGAGMTGERCGIVISPRAQPRVGTKARNARCANTRMNFGQFSRPAPEGGWMLVFIVFGCCSAKPWTGACGMPLTALRHWNQCSAQRSPPRPGMG